VIPDRRVLEARLGSRIQAHARVAHGDRRATFRLQLVDGRTVAAHWFAARAGAAREVAIVERLAASGVPVASPIDVVAHEAGAWLVTDWVDGRPGHELLDDVPRGLELATAMGRLAAELAGVATTGLELDVVPPRGPFGDLDSWRAAAEAHLGRPRADRVVEALDRVALQTGDARATFRHGDFAPVNAVVTPDGRVIVLDVEHACRSSFEIDVAWWAWVVRHHHPRAWQRIGATFLAASGVDVSGAGLRRLADLELLGLLRRAMLAGLETPAGRRWLDLLTDRAQA
jgi:aminoglycoside phosphotransferase (APT) family kinase protein